MWRVIFVLTVLTANCEPYSKKQKVIPGRNQRIIKVQGPPLYNHFHGGQKPIRKRPVGLHHREEFLRPNHPPPIPPFFNGPSVSHKKHLPRPPPHVFHKLPSYGLGYPYKSVSSFRPSLAKDHFRAPSVSPGHPGSISSSGSSSTTYHSPTFTASSFVSSPVSSPVAHIVSSDDNNGPIREIPAPDLSPKPHEDTFGGLGDLGGLGGLGVGHVESLGGIAPIGGLTGIGGVGLGGVENVGHVSHAESDAVLNGIGKETNVNLDAVIKEPGIESETYLKESEGDPVFGKEHTVEIANFDEGSSIDVTKLIKNAATSEHNSGYEVTEHHNHHNHHNHLPSNDQIIKGHDGSKLYYAPDPDPSLPVHKVPPTNDPHSTPSNGQNVNGVFIPPAPHGFPYLPGGPVGAPVTPLSSQELFHLMHGYPAVIQQPVVAFVSQPQDVIRTLSGGGGGGYYQQTPGGHYSQEDQYAGDVNQYLQQPEIHNLLHNSPKSLIEQDSHGVSHSSVVSHDAYPQQTVYSPQNHYRNYYQSQYKVSDPDSKEGDHATSEINHNYQYEPEASESDSKSSLTVIRQASEGTLNSETVKELLLEDAASNELNRGGSDEGVPAVLRLKNIPEVPFYASLPSKKAAEALATLQAAGSVASNYMNRMKISRGDETAEEEDVRGRRRKGEDEEGEGGDPAEKTVVEIQQSVPLYETSISSSEEDAQEDEPEFSEALEEDITEASSGSFGKRLRPK